MKHPPTVTIGNYTIPLIGLPEDAMLGECDLCHDRFSIQELEIVENGREFYCRKCRGVPDIGKGMKSMENSLSEK